MRCLIALAILLLTVSSFALPYTVVGTGQTTCYDTARPIAPPQPGAACYGQDAQLPGPTPAYRDNGDGTVTDLNTGLMWVKARGEKVTWSEAKAGAATCAVGGYRDWRMPTIKELYSLINFTGHVFRTAQESTPYLDARYFEFKYGEGGQGMGQRLIDCQDWSVTRYIGTVMNGVKPVFGVNFADGRIKSYPDQTPRGENRLYIRYVRGNMQYGVNDFADNGDGTVTDRATGLQWAQADSGAGMDWPTALAWVQARNAEKYLGHNDWRLPNAKELQSIVDYTRVPAIDPVFRITKLPSGEYPYFWSSTTHIDGPPGRQYGSVVYVAFGRALGWMAFPPNFTLQLIDVHGAGAQRSDPKVGNPADYPQGHGPQGDDVRINNCVRLVRTAR